ncbi:TVP38/TMEM64 family protein [Catenuloplanes indicus]|uniref:TVP38/TMEM64 family membrane protein n=1 Tax=Catenuloplanes indicus TaxID=137267 RepID=A0AAE3VY50_9ACTN|nr:VTT domain-containing protein [Catenuloplanes indicus]MDQ0365855.1 putative membrane protein YdjX (TVP38/TMEM64 family) [Catenuloplanes indicus]
MTDAAAPLLICPQTGRRLTMPLQSARSLPGVPSGPAAGHADAPAFDAGVPVAPRRSRKARLLRVAALVTAVAALGTAAATLPLHEIQDAARSLGWAAALVMAGVGALLLAVLVPRTAISLACGALLGPALGFTAAITAAMLAATITYFAGRWAGHGLLAARVGGRLHRLDGWLSQRGFSAVLLVRLLPLAPFGLMGYAYGTTSVRRHHYLLGTLVASTPSAFSYSILGAAVMTPGDVNPITFIPAVCGVVLTSTIVYRWRRASRRTAAD